MSFIQRFIKNNNHSNKKLVGQEPKPNIYSLVNSSLFFGSLVVYPKSEKK